VTPDTVRVGLLGAGPHGVPQPRAVGEAVVERGGIGVQGRHSEVGDPGDAVAVGGLAGGHHPGEVPATEDEGTTVELEEHWPLTVFGDVVGPEDVGGDTAELHLAACQSVLGRHEWGQHLATWRLPRLDVTQPPLGVVEVKFWGLLKGWRRVEELLGLLADACGRGRPPATRTVSSA
jgi:hypothetical protein